MALENVDYVTELVKENPPGTDPLAQGDDHIRLIKKVLTKSFPDVDRQASTIIVKTTAPSTQIKGTIWYDTTDDALKINTADDAATPSWSSGFFNAATTTAFRATMSAPLTVANTTLETVTFNTDGTDPTSFDLGTNFDTTTHKYTIPTTGYYYFASSTRWAGSPSGAHSVDDDLFLKRRVSTTETTLSSTTAWLQETAGGAAYIQAYPTYQVEGIFHLDKDDTVHVAVYTEGGAFSVSGGTQAYFQGFQIA